MSTTWYKIDRWCGLNGPPIIPIPVRKETPKMLVLEALRSNGKMDRVAKRSSWDQYFQTFDEAVEHLRTKYEHQQSVQKDALERATDKRNRFERWASTATDPEEHQPNKEK